MGNKREEKRKRRFHIRLLRLSFIAVLLLGVGAYFELHLALKIGEVVCTALLELFLGE